MYMYIQIDYHWFSLRSSFFSSLSCASTFPSLLLCDPVTHPNPPWYTTCAPSAAWFHHTGMNTASYCIGRGVFVYLDHHCDLCGELCFLNDFHCVYSL